MGPTISISKEIFDTKYAINGESFEEAMHRIASHLEDDPHHGKAFEEILQEQRFLPGGRIQAAAGTDQRQATMINCFHSKIIPDSMEGIMEVATEAAMTMRMGGGIGYNFSSLRPRGALIKTLGSQASGPVSFMGIYDAICKTVASAGHRRGAQMGTLRVDHPDIEEFIESKSNHDKLTAFNISIAITDEFMYAVKNGLQFNLRWGGEVYRTVDARALWDKIMWSTWDWAEPGVIFIDRMNQLNNLHYCEEIIGTNPCFRSDTLITTREGNFPIKDLVGKTVIMHDGDDWRELSNFRITGRNASILRITFTTGEHVDVTPYHTMILHDNSRVYASELKLGQILRTHSLHGATCSGVISSIEEDGVDEEVYCCTVPLKHSVCLGVGVVTGQCGEIPLSEHNPCLLGSFNLVKYIKDGRINYKQLIRDIQVVHPAMDNVIDRSRYPLQAQAHAHRQNRRLGIGITGLANALEKLGMPYGTKLFLEETDLIMRTICENLYLASSWRARSHGSFPLYDRDKFLGGEWIQRLSPSTRKEISLHGIRNSHLTSIAPTGTISLCADNVSSGIEPVFSHSYERTIQTFDGPKTEIVEDYAYREWDIKGRTANEISVDDHLNVLLRANKWVDNAVSKTCNVGADVSFEDFKDLYMRAYDGGAKGCTTFRASGKRYGILNEVEKADDDPQACYFDPATGQKSCS